jgi:hypothetical protein
MENFNKNIGNTTGKLREMYDNLSYFDQYGTSIIFFMLLTFIVFIIYSYFSIMSDIQPIKDDWINQRCNPKVLPFAGFINRPDGVSISDYTQENFTYCVQDVLKSVTGQALAPINFVTNTLQTTFNGYNQEINGVRGMINNVRQSIKHVSAEIMGRILNMLIPLLQITIGFKDVLAKTQGTLTGGLFTALGTYMTLQSALGAIVQLIVYILFGMLASIIAFWAVPFTWGAASALSITFLSIAVPLAVIVVFMTQVMHIKTAGVPKLKCFDKNTQIHLENGTFKSISDLVLGERLFNGSYVTALVKLDSSEMDMYELDGIIVSGCHKVKNSLDKYGCWISVRNHPLARRIGFYNEPYIYCINTSNKEIHINNLVYSDWDEIYNERLEQIVEKLGSVSQSEKRNLFFREDIHRYLDGGFSEDTVFRLENGEEKKIKDICVGDVLEKNNKIYGIVELDGTGLEGQYLYDLGKNKKFIGGPIIRFLKMELNDCKREKIPIEKRVNKLYHLLTEENTIQIFGKTIYDYNSCIDLF